MRKQVGEALVANGVFLFSLILLSKIAYPQKINHIHAALTLLFYCAWLFYFFKRSKDNKFFKVSLGIFGGLLVIVILMVLFKHTFGTL